MQVEVVCAEELNSEQDLVVETFCEPAEEAEADEADEDELDDTNYLSWRMQALATIRGHNLYRFLQGEKFVPTRFASNEDREKGIYTEEYIGWQCQDQLLVSWLFNSMSDGVVSKMVGCTHSYQVWDKVEELYCSSTRARERQLKNDLRSIKNGSSSMSEFLLKIKKIVDSLGAIGLPVSTHDHIESIFYGLDRDYESFMTSFSMRKEEYSITEIEALLLSQEARIEKLKKTIDNVTTNIAQRGGSQTNRSQNFQHQGYGNHFPGNRGGYQGRGNMQNQGPQNPFRANFPARGRGQPSSSNRGGRTWQGAHPQCQVCGKMGHIAVNCYNRYNQNFTAATFLQVINQPQVRPNNGAPVESFLATPEILNDDAWFADSGSSNHLTNNLSNIQVSQQYDGGEQVHIANGSGLPIQHIGSSELHHNSQTFKLNQILYVPELSKNLLSISNFARDNHVYFEFYPDDCFVKSQDSHQILLRGGRIYFARNVLFDEHSFPFKDSKTQTALPASNSATSPVPSIPLIFGTYPTLATQNTNMPTNSTNVTIEVSGSSLQQVPAMSPPPNPPVPTPTPPSLPQTTNPTPSVVPPTSTHAMTTRAKSSIFKPKAFLVTSEPTNVKNALAIPEWKAAMDKEFHALQSNHTWSLVPLPSNRKAIGSK
ncbi:Retrovirus-related Pol polyprotein from transposon TNT 1-94 [Senna tora]|uniref:Retrovirus-related Pol polyprotein from transposon TNT 1-94 n=1 Tax=Senna tora TaxID=362788 RepID=A0A834WCK0_9FABA|nr:Retrovirus-related Pol polyprotein from transposon TNT 1-94 [Senna tora]